MTMIYGVDTGKKISPADVRDAIVECFVEAHSMQLKELEEFAGGISQDEFSEIKRINVRQLIRNMFAESGGDFDNPDKRSIMAALEQLKTFSVNFRNQQIVTEHYNQIVELVGLLE